MSRALVLACGNSLRGDDGVAPYIAKCLREQCSGLETEIRADQQWAPELAEPISTAEIVIFIDASANLLPGKIACRALKPAPHSPAAFTHQTSPPALLSLANELYGRAPAQAYLVTIGASSFDLVEALSAPVRQAVPEAIKQIHSLLSEAPSM
jgi:hydrogenase maturation protease